MAKTLLLALQRSHERRRARDAGVASDLQHVAKFLGGNPYGVNPIGRVQVSGVVERRSQRFGPTQQPGREHTAPGAVRIDLLTFLVLVVCALRHALELADQLLHISDRRLRRQLAAQRLPLRHDLAPQELDRTLGHDLCVLPLLQQSQLDVEFANGAEVARERAQLAVEFLDLRSGRRPADNGQGLANAAGRHTCLV